jgi:hypothetical protein
MMISAQQSLEWELAYETELFWENMLQFHIDGHKSHTSLTYMEPGPSKWEVSE